jgi:hypothetical protein
MSIPHDAVMNALPEARRSRIEARFSELLAEATYQTDLSIEHTVAKHPSRQTMSIHEVDDAASSEAAAAGDIAPLRVAASQARNDN